MRLALACLLAFATLAGCSLPPEPESSPFALAHCGELGTHRAEASALSRDGSLYAYAFGDFLTVLDAETGAVVSRSLVGEGGEGALALEFARDGARVFLASGRSIRTLPVAGPEVLSHRVVFGMSLEVTTEIARDGEIALTEQEDRMFVVSFSDGSTRPLAVELASIGNFAISSDGTIVAFAQVGSVVIARLDDGSIVRSIDVPAGSELDLIEFAPDGQLVAVAHADPDALDTTLVHVARVDGSAVTELRERASEIGPTALAWAPDSSALYVTTGAEVVRAELAPSPLSVAAESRMAAPLARLRTLAVDGEGHVYAGGEHVTRVDRDGVTSWARAGELTRAIDRRVGFDDAGRLLADGVLWDLETGLAGRILDERTGRVAIGDEGRELAWIEGEELVIEGESAQRIALPFDPAIVDVEPSAVVIANEAEIAVVDRESGEVSARVRHQAGPGTPMILDRSPDGRFVVLGARADRMRLVDLATEADAPLNAAHARGSSAALFTVDGRLAYQWYQYGGLLVRDVDASSERRVELPFFGVAELPARGLVVAEATGVSLLDAETLDSLGRLERPWVFGDAAVGASADGTRAAVLTGGRASIICIEPR
jgi:hypothetical protein